MLLMLSESVIKLRESQGLSRRELAARSTVSYEMICKIENGDVKNVGIETLKKIAKGLEANLTALLDEAKAH